MRILINTRTPGRATLDPALRRMAWRGATERNVRDLANLVLAFRPTPSCVRKMVPVVLAEIPSMRRPRRRRGSVFTRIPQAQ